MKQETLDRDREQYDVFAISMRGLWVKAFTTASEDAVT